MTTGVRSGVVLIWDSKKGSDEVTTNEPVVSVLNEQNLSIKSDLNEKIRYEDKLRKGAFLRIDCWDFTGSIVKNWEPTN